MTPRKEDSFHLEGNFPTQRRETPTQGEFSMSYVILKSILLKNFLASSLS